MITTKIDNRTAYTISLKKDIFLNEIETTSIIRIKFRKLFSEIDKNLLFIQQEVELLLKDYPGLTPQVEAKLKSQKDENFLSILALIKDLETSDNTYELDLESSVITELANQTTKTDFSDIFEVLLQ